MALSVKIQKAFDIAMQTQPMSEKAADRITDTLATGSLLSWSLAFFGNLNIVLETLTLLAGLAAGMFAIFFHYRRWKNEHAKMVDEVKEAVVDEVATRLDDKERDEP